MKTNAKPLTREHNETRRKGAHSLYTNENPLNIENRVRVESNYTTRSGDRLMDTSQDKESQASAKKSSKIQPKVSRNTTLPTKKPSMAKTVTPIDSQKVQQQQSGHQRTSTLTQLPLQTKAIEKSKHHSRTFTQILSPKVGTQKLNLLDGHTKLMQSSQQSQSSLTTPKPAQKITFQEEKKAMKPILKKPQDLTKDGHQSLKSRNIVPTNNKMSSSTTQIKTTDKKKRTTFVKLGVLEQIDEVGDQNVQDHIDMALFSRTLTQISSQGQSYHQGPGAKPKISRQNSPKHEMISQFKTRTSKIAVPVKPPIVKNRVKANSQYATTPSQTSDFRNLFSTVEQGKKSAEKSSTKRPLKNGIPKSQERNRSTERSIEDTEDNVDEFVNTDTKNIQNLKSSTLVQSIAVNSTKHHRNAKDFNSLLQSSQRVHTQQYASQKTPDQMKLLNSTQKTSPHQLLGQTSSFVGQNKQPHVKHGPNQRCHQSSQGIIGRHYTEHDCCEQVHSNKYTYSHTKSRSQKITLNLQQNSFKKHISYHTLKEKSPQLQSDEGKNRMRAGRLSFWNVKRGDQNIPNYIENENNQNELDEKAEIEPFDLEETKTNEGAVTDVQATEGDDKMHLSQSEQKLRKFETTNNSKQMAFRLTISQANKNL